MSPVEPATPAEAAAATAAEAPAVPMPTEEIRTATAPAAAVDPVPPSASPVEPQPEPAPPAPFTTAGLFDQVSAAPTDVERRSGAPEAVASEVASADEDAPAAEADDDEAKPRG